MSRPLVILGTGGSACDVLDVVEAINFQGLEPAWEVVGFLDDAEAAGSRRLGFAVLGSLREAGKYAGHTFVNAIGSEKSFRRLPEILGATGLAAARFATLVHPRASVSSRARLGSGVIVNHGSSIGGGARIGDFVTLCPGSIVGHDASIEDYTVVAPGAIVSGFVRVGRGCYLGAGAMIRQHLEVGAGALVGMGAVVVRGVEAETVLVGNPARFLECGPEARISTESEK